VFVYNICDHEACYREVQSQAISYTTGVPGDDRRQDDPGRQVAQPGVWNMEQFDPDPFMEDAEPLRPAVESGRAECASMTKTTPRTERQAGIRMQFTDFQASTWRAPRPVSSSTRSRSRRTCNCCARAARERREDPAALKAFSMLQPGATGARYLAGTCASGLHEARLGREVTAAKCTPSAPRSPRATCARCWKSQIMWCSTVAGSWLRFRPLALARPRAGRACGSACASTPSIPKAPWRCTIPARPARGWAFRCRTSRRAGTAQRPALPHAVRAGSSRRLQRTLQAVEEKFGEFIPRMEWINFGGGHHITRPGYQVDELIRPACATSPAATTCRSTWSPARRSPTSAA
jgi:hypothetical protein